MSELCSILVLSNGHGEDIIGASLINELIKLNKNLSIKVLPIVGEGEGYKNLPVKLIGPRKSLPSGGLIRLSLKNFLKDLRAGLLGQTYDQIQTLRKIKTEVDMVICVGDVFLVILAGLFAAKPIIFIPTAKSEYLNGHYAVEKMIMRKYTSLVLPRDQKTADNLKEAKIPAKFVGNAMMDSFEISGIDFGISNDVKVVGILPGSRESAYKEMEIILKVVKYLDDLKVEPLEYLLALAEQLSLERLERVINELGWKMVYTNEWLKRGVTALLLAPEGLEIRVSKGYFGDILTKSDIFIGLAGTANEQAVGMGKPLVTYKGFGPQFHRRFLKGQKKLLGESISIVERDPEKIATEILVILHDEAKYRTMSEAGKIRMGPRGGLKKMAQAIIEKITDQGLK